MVCQRENDVLRILNVLIGSINLELGISEITHNAEEIIMFC